MNKLIENLKKNRQLTLVLIAGLAGLVLTIMALSLRLVSQRQEIRKQAATTTGVTNIRLNPATGTVAAGGTLSSQIKFNTKGRSISGISVLITYPYSGTTPGLQLTSADIIPDANLTGQNWVFPFKKVELVGNEVRIKIAGYTKALGGYSTGGGAPNYQEVNLAALNFKGNSEGVFSLNFSNLETKITEKSSALDVLLNPVSPAAAYTVSGGGGSQSIDTFQQGLNGYAGAKDTYVDKDYPSGSYCSNPIKVGNKQKYFGFLGFDLSSIPAGSIINSASLEIYATSWGGKNLAIDAFESIADWACPNWSNKPDRKDVILGTIAADAINKWFLFDLKNLVQIWVNQPATNKGIILRGQDLYDGTKTVTFASAEYTDISLRPRLTVNYQRP